MPEKMPTKTMKRLSFVSDTFRKDTYQDVAQRARLREISVVESDYFCKPHFFQEADETGKQLKNMFSGAPSGPQFDEELGLAVGGYEWLAEIKFERTKALKLKVRYMVVYGGLVDCEQDYVRLYFEKVARFTSYPYFRAHFAMLAGSSGLTLPSLPSLTDRVD